MKILFAAPENAWGGFLHLVRARLPRYQFDAAGDFRIDTLKGYDVLIPTMCPVTQDILADGDRLRLIQQCGAGLEGVDVDAARALDIWVANVPTDVSGNADSVAELGIYMMIGLARDVPGMARCLASRKMGEPRGKSLSGRTVGLVGLGGIGQALVKRLRGFGVTIIGIKQHAPEQAQTALALDWVGGPQDLPKLLAESDFVILCLPLTAESKGLLNETTFRLMKPGSFLINLSRGGLIERNALESALATGLLAGVGLDVFWEEPPDPADPIFSYNIMATPHIGGSTDTSMQGIADGVAENIKRIERNQPPRNHVNR